MMDPKAFDDLAKLLVDAVPPSLRQFQTDMEKNARVGLQAALSKLDVVTREEFAVQQAVLERTRAKVDALERQLAELDPKLAHRRRKEKPGTTEEKAAGTDHDDAP